MSKIYEALKFSDGETADAVLPALMDPGAGLSEVVPPPLEMGPQPESPAAEPQGAVSVPPVGIPDMDAQAIRVLPLRVPEFSPVLPFDDSHFRASEQYRIIRTRIIQHPSKPCMIVVSSPGPRDGKSVTALNLAGAMALKAAARVLLVDADFRRATIHEQIGFEKIPGLADVLEGRSTLEAALIRTEQFPSLYVLPAGELRGNPAELLDSPQWTSLCGRFHKLFEYVIVDSPPITAVADYDLIQASCDGVIVVARPDHTNRKRCFEAVERIPKAKMLGVLLNCVSDWFLARPYSYESYYYRR